MTVTLRQSTGVTVTFGPILFPDGQFDDSAGPAMDFPDGGIYLLKNGAVGVNRNEPVTTSEHDHYGYYRVVMDETDTGDLGILEMIFGTGDHGTIPTFRNFEVISAQQYDQKFGPGLPAVGSVTGAVGSVTGSVGGSIAGNLGGSVLGGVTLSGSVTVGTISAGAINGCQLETGVSMGDMLRINSAMAAGRLLGIVPNQGGSCTIFAMNDSKPRIIASLDGNGNRTGVTLDATP